MHAQVPARTMRVGVLMAGAEHDPVARAQVAALLEGLQELGWTQGRNIAVDYRRAAADSKEFPLLAKQLVALHPDVIVSVTTTAAAALKQQTNTIPIAFVNAVDPIGSSLVANLARPGGNFTGFIHFEPGMAGKWLGMLKQVAPQLTHVGILYSPKTLPLTICTYVQSRLRPRPSPLSRVRHPPVTALRLSV